MSRDNAWIKVDGRVFDRWKGYSIQQDITVPGAGFRFETTAFDRTGKQVAELRERLDEGVKVTVGVTVEHQGKSFDAVQMEGFITRRDISATRNGGTQVEVEGLDKSGYLTKPSADVPYSPEMSFADLAKEVVAPWGIEVTHDAKSARDVQTGKVRLTTAQHRLLEQARFLSLPVDRIRRNMLREADDAARAVDVAAAADIAGPIAAITAGGLTPADLRRLSLKDAKPEFAETRWSYLQRHAERLGIFMRMSPDGRLVLSVPDYTQPPSYLLMRTFDAFSNVVEGRESRNSDSRYSAVTAHGNVKLTDKVTKRVPYGFSSPDGTTEAGVSLVSENAPRQKATITVFDDTDPLPFDRVLVIHDREARTIEQLERRASRELAQAKQGFLTWEYVLPGHGQNALVYAPDTVARVLDEHLGIYDTAYVRARSLEKSQQGGTVTRLTLIPRYSIVP